MPDGETLGVDCTVYLSDPDRFCGAPAHYVRRDADGAPVAVLCDGHRAPGDRYIPDTVARAPRAEFLRERRFVTP